MSKCPSEAPPASAVLSSVKHVIAVGAGKGGVGKSTIAALLAVGLNRKGYRVGLLDADVYGPSLPKITGSEGAQPDISDDGLIVPPVKHGIRIMSMGYLVPPDEAVIWRGPMAQKYVKELLERGDWGELDFLLIDLPPGTGDIPLTLAQTVPLAGMVIVCTPQDVALADAVKAVQMYRRLDVKLLGMIENMSFYVCPACGSRDEIFGHGGAEAAARRLELAFLGAIPLNITIRRNGDAGALLENFTTADPPVVQALENTVERLIEQIDRPDEPDAAPPQVSGD
jgi:ATP-binding protein involved in chromosome partitioning